jgi:hypothetical protein
MARKIRKNEQDEKEPSSGSSQRGMVLREFGWSSYLFDEPSLCTFYLLLFFFFIFSLLHPSTKKGCEVSRQSVVG